MKRLPALIVILILAVSCGTARKATQVNAAPDSPEEPSVAYEEPTAQQIAEEKAYEKELTQELAEEAAADNMPIEDQIIAYAMEFLGVPYKFGASGPKEFDCSGFTREVFGHFGYDIAHSSQVQYTQSKQITSYSQLRRGDLVFFGGRKDIRKIGHVGIVVDVVKSGGYFTFIHASFTHGVEIQRSTLPYFLMRYIGAGRLIEEDEKN